MTGANYYDYLTSSASHNVVSQPHFGINYVAGKNSTEQNGTFENITQKLGAGHIRFPGGTVTEKYFDPHSDMWDTLFVDRAPTATAEDGTVIEGPTEVFAFAERNDLDVQFVLPTAHLFKVVDGEMVIDQAAVEKIQLLVRDVLNGEFGDVRIDNFEIGNEYYSHAGLTAAQYAEVANEVIGVIDEEIITFRSGPGVPDGWSDPGIAIQTGAGWRSGDNTTIIEGLSTASLDVVDGVILHYYPHDIDDVDARDRHLNQLAEWEAAVGSDDLNFFVSEWNVSNFADEHDAGMAQASTMVSAFSTLIEHGVDTASIWGTQFRWLETGLSVNTGSDDLSMADSRLSVAGEMFASMSETLVGLGVIDGLEEEVATVRDAAGRKLEADSGDYQVEVFGNGDRAVMFISSRSDSELTIDLNLDEVFGEYTHAHAETLTSRDDPLTGWRDESDPNAAYGIADFESISFDELKTGDSLKLESYEVMRVAVQLSDDGVVINDHDPLIDAGLSYDDVLVGSDSDDQIDAHIGNDTLKGGGGDDKLSAGIGDDNIFGEVGNDWLIGGKGNDTVSGGAGDDILSGNVGDDVLSGGAGNDIISSGGGKDTLSGGSGGDYFVISSACNATIVDFDAGAGDSITFLGQFESVEDLLGNMSETAGEDGQSGDIVLEAENGPRVIFTGAAGQQEAIASTVIDFQESGENALSLSTMLNDSDEGEIATLLEELGTEEFAEVFGNVDNVILFANLSPRAAAELLDAFDEDELEEFLGGIEPDGLKLALSEWTDHELSEFSSVLSESARASILEDTNVDGSSETQDLSGDQTEFATASPEEEFLPIIPETDETSDSFLNEDESDEDGVVAADCFVATVVYQDGWHPDVWLLRWYRDAVMRNSLLGRMAIRFYWWQGPKLAEWVSGRPGTSRTIRKIVEVIVRCISARYQRAPGKQLDQPSLGDSRRIRLRRSVAV